MNEEYLVIGKNNPAVYPELTLWGWPIAVYLFLGGLAAGIMIFYSLSFLIRGENGQSATIRKVSLLVPPALVLGLLCLLIDLHNLPQSWRLFTIIRWESPMSWGAWTLLLITPLSVLWCLRYIRELYPTISFPAHWYTKLEARIDKHRKWVAWSILVLSLVLGIYTGILLSAFNARPLWNNSVLGLLFLVSGLSTAAALIIWSSHNRKELQLFRRLDIGLIVIELLLIIHMFMGLLAGTAIQVSTAEMFLGGSYALAFWGLVVTIGLVIPIVIEIAESLGLKTPHFVAPALVIIGGLAFRIILVYAGQVSSFPA
ncbi:MAG: polysulfide reductase NrfD [Cyclobacteriaceae bacterium]